MQYFQEKVFMSRYAQKEKVSFIKMFQDQTEAVFKHLSGLLKMLDNQHVYDEDIINLSTDNLLISINEFAKNCYRLHQERNNEALDFAKQTVEEEWNSFSKITQNKADSYYSFMLSALYSPKLVKITEERQLSQHEQQLEKKALSNPNNLNNGFAKLIKSNYNYDKKSQNYMNDERNKQLECEQNKKINEYRKNSKNRKNNQYKNGGHANVNNFYFTKSGKQSKFVNDNGNDVGDIVMNGDEWRCNNYYNAPQITNAVIKLSQSKKLLLYDRVYQDPIPCAILSFPDNEQNKFNLKLADPISQIVWIDPEEYEIVYKNDKRSQKYICKIEIAHKKYYNTGSGLGYVGVDGPDLTEL